MIEKAMKLYKQVVTATQNGKDAEIRVNKQGEFIVYSVKRSRTVEVVK